VLNNLKSSGHQLHQSDDIPGIYFFHSTISKDWDETPFEFDLRIAKDFASLPELPVTREKGKVEEFVSPIPSQQKTPAPPEKKEKPAPKKAVMVVSKGPEQPDYDLKHDIHFTDLERIVFRQAALSKRHVLDYYDKMAEYILPYLKDRPHLVRQQAESGPKIARAELKSLPKRPSQEIPGWVQSVTVDEADMFLCNDKEHLMLYAELGCVEFDPCLSRKRSLDTPDYIVIGIDSSEFSKVVDVANVAHEIFDGLQLPSHIKTDGVSGLHVYITLDSKSDFDTALNVAEYICKLVRLKLPNLVVLKGSDENDYGKVVLDPSSNRQGSGIVAPYSFVAEGAAIVATPLLWEEVTDSLRIDDFNHKTIFERLKKDGDPFEHLFKKKIDAAALLERLEENYSFLI
jgi:bifunctional non-homologous end joining protein LigD